MTGYGVNKYFQKKVGSAASPSTVYSSLAKLERKGWIKCIRDNPGRVYTLTPVGEKIAEEIPSMVGEAKRFLDKLLRD